MPTTPEFGAGGGEVGTAEIFHEINAENACRTNGDAAVSSKVTVDLKSKEEGGEGQCGTVTGGGSAVHMLYGVGESVGDDDFDEQALSHETQPIGNACVVEGDGTLKLRKETLSALDGTSDKLGEEGNIEGKAAQMTFGGHSAAIDFDSVAERLEGVEGDAYG